MSRKDKIALIISHACEAFEADPKLVTATGYRGPNHIARTRQVAMWLISMLVDATRTECALAVGKTHHSTVIYAIKQVEDYRSVYDDFRATTDKLYRELEEHFSISAEE